MQASDVGFVALRITALLMVVGGLFGLIESFSLIGYGELEGTNTAWLTKAQIASSLLILALAGYLFVKARRVAKFLFSSAGDLEVTASIERLQAVAFSVVGVVIAMRAVPPLATNLAQFIWVARGGADLEREAFLSFGTFFDVFYSAVELALGALLFFNASWLAGRWSEHQR